MQNIKERLMNLAHAKGICLDGYNEMRRNDVDGLISYYISNPDWCLERDFPPLKFLNENFSNIEDKGVFKGKTFHGELLNDLQTYIFHDCKGTIKVGLNVDKAIIPMLYFSNSCHLRIVGVGDVKPRAEALRTEIPLYVFGHNDINARDNYFVKFKRYDFDIL